MRYDPAMTRAVWLALALAHAACAKSDAAPARVERSPPPSQAPPQSAIAVDPPPASRSPTRYPFDRSHSPIDAVVSGRVRAIASKNPALRENTFAKVGDSVTASGDSLHCLASRDRTLLGEHTALGPVLERFRESPADPFRRESHAARVGWSAWIATAGAPSPLAREISAIAPRFALVQFGTNDIEIGQLHYFADRLFDIVDYAIERGVVPILFTIMSRRDRTDRAIWVPRYNAVIRGIAQARKVPLVDYHRELAGLPGAGLAKDGIHPTTYLGDLGRNACDFRPSGLEHGYNVRNLLALEALGRAGAAIEGRVLDSPSPELPGSGTSADPWRVDALPFVDFPRFDGRGRVVYELDLARSTSLRAMGFDRGGEVDLELEGAGQRAERILEARLDPGPRRIVLTARKTATETLFVALAD
jgi:hypothetical protein